jgi:hypothetical protein
MAEPAGENFVWRIFILYETVSIHLTIWNRARPRQPAHRFSAPFRRIFAIAKEPLRISLLRQGVIAMSHMAA